MTHRYWLLECETASHCISLTFVKFIQRPLSFLFSFTEDVNVGEMLKQDLQFHFHVQLLQPTQVQSMPFMLPRRLYLWQGG